MDFISERKTNRRPRQSSSCGGVASGVDGMWRARWRGRRAVGSGGICSATATTEHMTDACAGEMLLHPSATQLTSSPELEQFHPPSGADGGGGGDWWNHWHAVAAAVAVTQPRLLARPGRNQPVRRKILILASCLRSDPAQEVRRPSNELRGPGWKVHGGAEQMRSVLFCRASQKRLLPTRFGRLVSRSRLRRSSDRSVAPSPRRPTPWNLPGCASVNHVSVLLTSVYPGKGLFDKTQQPATMEDTPLSPRNKKKRMQLDFPLRWRQAGNRCGWRRLKIKQSAKINSGACRQRLCLRMREDRD